VCVSNPCISEKRIREARRGTGALSSNPLDACIMVACLFDEGAEPLLQPLIIISSDSHDVQDIQTPREN